MFSRTNNKVMTINNTSFEPMDADKDHDRQVSRQTYANRTDADKDHDRQVSRVRYANRTDAEKDHDRQRARERYANRTDAQKDAERARDRQRYARAHPNARTYRTPDQVLDDLIRESTERREKYLKRRAERSQLHNK